MKIVGNLSKMLIHSLVFLYIALIAEAKHKIELSCESAIKGDCIQNKKQDISFPVDLDDAFTYKAGSEINGTFTRGFNIESAGDCFDSMRYSLKGMNDQMFTQPVIWKEEEEEMVPDLGEINLCQQVHLYGYIYFRQCPGLEVNKRSIPYYPTFSPIQTWLEGKADDKYYPHISLSPENVPVVSWGLATEFGCESSRVNTKADIKYKITQENTGKVRIEEHTFAGPDMFKDIILSNLKVEDSAREVRDLDWNLEIDLKLTFYGKNIGSSQQPQKSIIFKRKLHTKNNEKTPGLTAKSLEESGNSSNRFSSWSIYSFISWVICILVYK